MMFCEALKAGEDHLKSHNIADAQTDAWLLLEYVTGLGRTRYLAERMQEMPEEAWRRYQELLQKRAGHIPLQHLTGEQDFMGLTFRVSRDVLIPRQDTEILAEEALKLLEPDMRALDLCTGSGCIAISLDRLRTGRRSSTRDQIPPVDAADISAEALAVAAENVRNLQAQVRLIESDLFEEITGTYDMIVSNPPYIPTGVIGELDREVRLYEPYGALDGKEDGLYFYREIIRQSGDYLVSGGWILFEIGYDQARPVTELLADAGYQEIKVIRDLAGLDRVVMGHREN